LVLLISSLCTRTWHGMHNSTQLFGS
jgi:hypothetical protein